MKLFKYFVGVQATYILITGVWPLIDIESFMAVTGPKTDVWLVKTVGALLIPVSLAMFAHLFHNGDTEPLIVLGSFTALAFLCIDLYYTLTNVISEIYLADALVEFIFLIGWIFFAFRRTPTK
jgi:hypothetical protein